MRFYTVSQLSRLAGVSVRTLHHYDHIGLLRPAAIAENGYRHYGREELLRLQQILLHRDMGMALADIARILDAPDFDRMAALRDQRRRLLAEAERYRQLAATIDRTITLLEGEDVMDAQRLYEGFTPEKQAEHEDWLVRRYGPAMQTDIARSKQARGRQDRAEQMRDLADIESALIQAMGAGIPPEDTRLDGPLTRHLDWVAASWGRRPDADAYAGLAAIYRDHPEFQARYEALAPGFGDYLPLAMEAFAIRVMTKA